jgi:hypothetical protein
VRVDPELLVELAAAGRLDELTYGIEQQRALHGLDVTDLVRVSVVPEEGFEPFGRGEPERPGKQHEQVLAFEATEDVPGLLVVDGGDVGPTNSGGTRAGHGFDNGAFRPLKEQEGRTCERTFLVPLQPFKWGLPRSASARTPQLASDPRRPPLGR